MDTWYFAFSQYLVYVLRNQNKPKYLGLLAFLLYFVHILRYRHCNSSISTIQRTFYAECYIYRYVNGTRLDDRIVRTDWDAGFVEGRQYGRGKSGGQVWV